MELITLRGLRGRQYTSCQYKEVKEVQHDPQPVVHYSGLAAIACNSCVQKGLICSVCWKLHTRITTKSYNFLGKTEREETYIVLQDQMRMSTLSQFCRRAFQLEY